MPPEIIDSDSSPSTVNIRENYNASLSCKATGIPDPEIIWKREDGRKIVLKRKKKEGKRGKNPTSMYIFHNPYKPYSILPILYIFGFTYVHVLEYRLPNL